MTQIHLAVGLIAEHSNTDVRNLRQAVRPWLDPEMTHIHLAATSWNFYSDHAPQDLGAEMRLRILMSYHYYQDADLDVLFDQKFGQPYPELFVDSGGFSAFTKGVTIDLAGYQAWIRRWSHWITTYANLDVIGSADATLANQQRMEDAGFHPLPVFHVNEPWDRLEAYIDAYPYIALGGLVPVGWQSAMPWLIKAFKLARPDPTLPPRAVYHGFGVSTWEVLKKLPFYSVDASSWGSGFRYGALRIFDPAKGSWATVHVGEKGMAMRYARVLRSYGLEPAEMWDRKRYHHEKAIPAAALSWIRAEAWLRRIHGTIVIPDRDDIDPGLKQYLCCGSSATGDGATRFVPVNDAVRDNGPKINLATGMTAVGDHPQAVVAAEGLKAHLAMSRQDEGGAGGGSPQQLARALQPGLKAHLAVGCGGDDDRIPGAQQMIQEQNSEEDRAEHDEAGGE